jgi:hypothetical protein
MDAARRPQNILHSALEQLLRPLCRLLLRHSVSYGAFEEIAKRVYVDVARHDSGIAGKKPTTSRIAVLSGLTRKEVQRLLAQPEEDAIDVSDRYNRASRVLTGWVRDADFLDRKGKPRALDVDGRLGFAALVKRYSGDIPSRAILDELLRVGAVRQRADAQLELVTHAYVPHDSEADKLGILGNDVADLIRSIDHNLEHGASDPRFQRKVMYDAVPLSALPAFRKLSARQAQTLLERLDRWLAEHEIIPSPTGNDPPRARVGLGIYYFEERLESHVVEGDTP